LCGRFRPFCRGRPAGGFLCWGAARVIAAGAVDEDVAGAELAFDDGGGFDDAFAGEDGADMPMARPPALTMPSATFWGCFAAAAKYGDFETQAGKFAGHGGP